MNHDEVNRLVIERITKRRELAEVQAEAYAREIPINVRPEHMQRLSTLRLRVRSIDYVLEMLKEDLAG